MLQFLTSPDTKMTTSKVRVQHLTKSFRIKKVQMQVLDDVSFEIARGEFVCLLGPSGCGKSTLLSLLAGLDTDFDGAIFDDDKTVQGPSTDRVVMFQDPTLFPWLNVIDNIAFGLNMQGLSKATRETTAERYLKMVHLARFKHWKTTRWSNTRAPSARC
ncbi:MAG: ATP-binding cassette domain-containing protein [Chloroflexi bacterium]|nr:ATP-binding cassette domain-containing protein [Chloroflexota bacterium]